MVKTKLEDMVLWITIEGDLKADEVIVEFNKWIPRKNEFIGLITDVRQMGASSAVDQKKLADQRRKNNLNKPHAILGKDSAFSVLVDIFVRFTRSENTRYFSDPEKAKEWLRSQSK